MTETMTDTYPTVMKFPVTLQSKMRFDKIQLRKHEVKKGVCATNQLGDFGKRA